MQIPVNYLAVVIAAFAAFGLGVVRYMVLFKPWLRVARQHRRRRRPQYVVPFLITFMALLLMAWMLAGLMGHLAQLNIRGGVMTAFFVWVGFVVTTLAVNHAFAGAKPDAYADRWRILARRACDNGRGHRRFRHAGHGMRDNASKPLPDHPT